METDGQICLTLEEEDELLAALEEIHRGDFVDGQNLVDELRSQLASEKASKCEAL